MTFHPPFLLALAVAALCGCTRPAAPPPPATASPMSEPAPPAPEPEPAAPEPAPERFFLPHAEGAALFAEAGRRGLPAGGLLLVVDAAAQKAALVSKAGPFAEFPVSTSAFGTGSRAGSNQTPLGWHRVRERFGKGAAPGTMFVSRRPNGRVLADDALRAPDPAEDAVLTRVLWLEGLEPGLNKGPGIDSHERCIYLHGTNQEQKLGMPASHGCVRFANADVVRLFDLSEGVDLFCFLR